MKKKTPERIKLRLFAFAGDWPDLHYTTQVLRDAQVEMEAEGSGIRGFGLYSPDALRAKSCITQSHRYRTGDLRIFFLQHPLDSSGHMHPEDSSQFNAWHDSLNRQRDAIAQLIDRD